MKRLTVAIFCLLLILAAAPLKPVYAATPPYARAITEKAYFYEKKDDETSLFAVPRTYCIEVIDEDGEWYHALYASDFDIYRSVEGYCKKEHFSPEYEKPQTTYLYKKISVSYKADGNPSSLPVLSDITREAAYYGNYEKGGADYSYVYCQGSFGYILGKYNYELNIPTPTPDDSDGNGGSGAGLNFATIAFIVIASLSVVVILIIYFTTKKPRIDG